MWRSTKLPEPSLMEGVFLLSTSISDCFHLLWDEVVGTVAEKWAQSSAGCVGFPLISAFSFNRKRTELSVTHVAQFSLQGLSLQTVEQNSLHNLILNV